MSTTARMATAALVTAPASYAMFRSMERRPRTAVSAVLVIVATVFTGLFLGAASASEG